MIDARDKPTAEIKVTSEMIEAGLEELREHDYAGDTRYMLECIYRTMAYASASASPIIASK